jgi:hypothetical protein
MIEMEVHAAAWRCDTYYKGETTTEDSTPGCMEGPLLLLESCLLILHQRTEKKNGDAPKVNK